MVIFAALVGGCLERMELPPVEDISGNFSVGDTTYLSLNPVWGPDKGLMAPVEISISHARQIFVADTGLHDIAVFNFSGERLDEADPVFKTLDFTRLGDNFTPLDIAIDGQLNLLVTDGSNKVYRWNQYWNIHGIDSIATQIALFNQLTSESVQLGPDDSRLTSYLGSPEWALVLETTQFTKLPATADSLLFPHLFMDMSAPVNDQADRFYFGDKTTFSAISRARLDDDFFYLTDSTQNRLVKANMVRNGLVKLGNGEILFTHEGRFDRNIAEEGTGAGTLNSPTGLDVDDQGNILYSQIGEFVYVHSIAPLPDFGYPTIFELQEHEIMSDLWYDHPSDIAVDEDQLIYIANTYAQEILVFNGEGEFFRKAGISTEIVDTVMVVQRGDSAVAIDTFVVIEHHDILSDPVSVDVDERGVIYVSDPAQSSIFRFILSTNIDEGLINIE